MLTTSMKFISIVVLTLAALFWPYGSSTELPVRFIVGLGAFMVFRQALTANRRLWAAGFGLLLILFNPFVPFILFSGKIALLIVLGTIVPFAASVPLLKTQPVLSLQSITDRTPGSISL